MKAVSIASPQALVVVPAPITDQVLALGVDPARVLGARDGTAVVDVPDGVRVTALPAEHGVEVSDAYGFGRADGPGGREPARFLGYVVEVGGVRVFHGGDTLWWDGMADRLRTAAVQVALLPINGRDRAREDQDFVGNLNAREAALLAAAAGVDLVVPMHWDVFAKNLGIPAELVNAVDRLDLGVNVLVPRRMRPFRYVGS